MRVDLDQGSAEWHDWRRGEGAIPAIGGSKIHPLLAGRTLRFGDTLTTLVCHHLGYLPRGIPSPRMERGTHLELFVREHAETYWGHPWPPTCHTSDAYPVLRVSTDGEHEDELWEAKCPMLTHEDWVMEQFASTYRTVRDQRTVPDWYMGQAQAELLATEASLLRFSVYLVDDWSDEWKATVLAWRTIAVPPLPYWQQRIITSLEAWRANWERTLEADSMEQRLAHWVSGWGLPEAAPSDPETGEVLTLETLGRYL